MDTRQLRYFCSVAELRSFTRAARALRVAQPAISRQIRKLEEEIGLDLIVRSGSGLELTDAGQVLFDRGQVLLREMDQLRDSLVAQFKARSDRVALAAPHTASALLMPSVLREARAALPGLSITVSEQVGQVVVEQLLNRQLSLGLMFDPAPHRELHAEPLVIERLHLYGRAGSRCSDPTPVRVEDLAGLPLVLPPYPHNVRVLVEDAAAEAGFALTVAYELTSLAVQRNVVAQEGIYGILTAGSIHPAGDVLGLVSKPIEARGLSMALTMVLRSEAQRSPTLRTIMGLIRARAARLIQEKEWPGQPSYVSV